MDGRGHSVALVAKTGSSGIDEQPLISLMGTDLRVGSYEIRLPAFRNQ